VIVWYEFRDICNKECTAGKQTNTDLLFICARKINRALLIPQIYVQTITFTEAPPH